ncbi:hypothetical protein MNBD_DELTA01-1766 [hydrothermal vent metagenome]|uniref:Uncharacterized protein n=1 Tax=hydrothermal vent metagenome TaxID=652676 RepID=A0A3B0QM86_9ZZZZ
MKTFATALNCIDGRIQLPVIKQVQELSGAEYVDMITETGIDRLLTDEAFRKTIQQKMDISIEKHGSKFIAVVAHYDCAGNPVDEATHRVQTKASRDLLKSLYPQLTVIGIWVDEEFKTNIIGD